MEYGGRAEGPGQGTWSRKAVARAKSGLLSGVWDGNRREWRVVMGIGTQASILGIPKSEPFVPADAR